MKFPIGSLCVIVAAHESCKYLIGRECTILTHEIEHIEENGEYKIDVEGEKTPWYAHHYHLRLRKFPPALDSWCKEKMDDLLTKLTNNITEEDLVR